MTKTEKDGAVGNPPEDLEKAFVHLFNRYYGPVNGFFVRRGFSAEASKDLSQETFIRAYRAMSGLRDEAGMGNWIFRIAKNLLKNEVRSLATQKRRGVEVPLEGALYPTSVLKHEEDNEQPRRHKVDAEIESSGEASEMPGKLLSEERARILRDALEELPPQMRFVVILRVTEELKYHEIAKLLGLQIGTVKSQLFQAKERLRVNLADKFPEIDF